MLLLTISQMTWLISSTMTLGCFFSPQVNTIPWSICEDFMKPSFHGTLNNQCPGATCGYKHNRKGIHMAICEKHGMTPRPLASHSIRGCLAFRAEFQTKTNKHIHSKVHCFSPPPDHLHPHFQRGFWGQAVTNIDVQGSIQHSLPIFIPINQHTIYLH